MINFFKKMKDFSIYLLVIIATYSCCISQNLFATIGIGISGSLYDFKDIRDFGPSAGLNIYYELNNYFTVGLSLANSHWKVHDIKTTQIAKESGFNHYRLSMAALPILRLTKQTNFRRVKRIFLQAGLGRFRINSYYSIESLKLIFTESSDYTDYSYGINFGFGMSFINRRINIFEILPTYQYMFSNSRLNDHIKLNLGIRI